MEGIAHDPYLWFGIGIPVCLVTAFVLAKTLGTIFDNISRARKQEQKDKEIGKVNTGTMNIDNGNIKLDKEK